MELAEIIKWVDKTNLYLELGECEYTTNARQINNETKMYICEYEMYVYAISALIIQMQSDNREVLIRRLFRHSIPFFKMYEIVNDEEKGWIYDAYYIDDIIGDGVGDCLEDVLYSDLLAFYQELIRICIECELNAIELCPYEYKAIIETILESTAYMNLRRGRKIHQPKKWEDYIIGENKTKWENLIREELTRNAGKNGKLTATIMRAMERNNSIRPITNRKKFYNALRVDFDLSSDESINKYLKDFNGTPISEDEIDQMINKVGCY